MLRDRVQFLPITLGSLPPGVELLLETAPRPTP